MRIGRTLPPAAAPNTFNDLLNGLAAMRKGSAAIKQFRESLCRYFEVRHCFLLSSGAAALSVILKALRQLSPTRDQVVIPAFTCFSVPSAIKKVGLSVCPCDLEPGRLDLNHKALELLIDEWGERILAIIPTHLYGVPANVCCIRRFVGPGAITVIEDAAQAMGSKGSGGPLGVQGDVGIISLGRGKAFSTGEGGIILTNKDVLAEAIKQQVSTVPDYGIFQWVRLVLATFAVQFFSKPALFWLPKALPFLRVGETIYNTRFPVRKLSAFQAGLAVNWAERLAMLQNIRRSNASQWRRLCRRLDLDDSMIGHARAEDLIRYPLCVDNPEQRRKILAISEQQGLGIMPGYPTTVSKIPELKDELAAFSVQCAEKVADTVLTLPTHPFVAGLDRGRIVRLLSHILEPQGDAFHAEYCPY